MIYDQQVRIELALLEICIGVQMSGYLQLVLLSIEGGCVGRQPGALIRQLCCACLQGGLLVGQLLEAPLLLLSTQRADAQRKLASCDLLET